MGAEELGGGFADGFGAGGGVGVLAAEVGEAGFGEGRRFGVEEGGAGGVDSFEGLEGEGEGFGFEDGGELLECEVVDVAEVEGGEVGSEEVGEEGAGEVSDGVGVGEVSVV